MKKILFCLPLLLLNVDASASIAYGSLNNFDTYNDTGVQAHGFEIEIDDVLSTNITYTYNYNHYGAPKITEDHNDPAHPNRVFVRYESPKDASGNFTAFTAVPLPQDIKPTLGHQCTNPGVNLGCEHFGVGYYGGTTVKYNWLIEDTPGSGNLVHGPAVNVATPTYTYVPPVILLPPAPNQPPIIQQRAQVIAKVVAPPEPPEIDPKEFGNAVWVKQIITTTFSKEKVELKDLVSDDPANPNDKNWANGEPAEVETEWELQQKEFSKADGGKNNELEGAAQEFNPDEVVTRRYEFYEYIGEFDPESNEALCDSQKVCPEAVGKYIGAQMVGFNAEVPLGLIDNLQPDKVTNKLQDGNYLEPYVDRTMVIGGNTPYHTSVTVGSLPNGLSIDSETGVLSGTPEQSGLFTFTVEATDTADPNIGHEAGTVSKVYTLNIVSPVIPPIQFINNIPDGNVNAEIVNVVVASTVKSHSGLYS